MHSALWPLHFAFRRKRERERAGAGWGRLRGRRKGILQEDFTRHNIEGGLGGLEAESGPSPHSVGDKLKEMRAQAAVQFGGDDENGAQAQAEEEQPALGRSFRRESRNMFVGRMHRKHIVPLRTMGSAEQQKQQSDRAVQQL